MSMTISVVVSVFGIFLVIVPWLWRNDMTKTNLMEEGNNSGLIYSFSDVAHGAKQRGIALKQCLNTDL